MTLWVSGKPSSKVESESHAGRAASPAIIIIIMAVILILASDTDISCKRYSDAHTHTTD